MKSYPLEDGRVGTAVRPEPARAGRFEHSDIVVAIPTFNRLEVVSLAARSLGYSKEVDRVQLWVIDDASTEYDVDVLRQVFPSHARIVRNERNSGRADYAVFSLMQRFLDESDAQVLILLDSDLLVATDWISRVLNVFDDSMSVLSLLNAHTHPGVPYPHHAESLLSKPSVGFAGTVWPRAVIREIVARIPASKQFDWDICDYLAKREGAILCLAHSAVQHIGAMGQNSEFLSADYGLGFSDTSWHNLAAIQEYTLMGMRSELLRQRQCIEELQSAVYGSESHSVSYQLKRVFRRVRRMLR